MRDEDGIPIMGVDIAGAERGHEVRAHARARARACARARARAHFLNASNYDEYICKANANCVLYEKSGRVLFRVVKRKPPGCSRPGTQDFELELPVTLCAAGFS